MLLWDGKRYWHDPPNRPTTRTRSTLICLNLDITSSTASVSSEGRRVSVVRLIEVSDNFGKFCAKAIHISRQWGPTFACRIRRSSSTDSLIFGKMWTSFSRKVSPSKFSSLAGLQSQPITIVIFLASCGLKYFRSLQDSLSRQEQHDSTALKVTPHRRPSETQAMSAQTGHTSRIDLSRVSSSKKENTLSKI